MSAYKQRLIYNRIKSDTCFVRNPVEEGPRVLTYLLSLETQPPNNLITGNDQVGVGQVIVLGLSVSSSLCWVLDAPLVLGPKVG